MPFDMGFNCRSTAGFVTDPSYAVPVLGEAYPHTYTNADGKSVNAGWDVSRVDSMANRENTNDPRIAGVNFTDSGVLNTFTVDLASGSAPGPGTYVVDIAAGDTAGMGGGVTENVLLEDGATPLISESGVTINNRFLDASGAIVEASTIWTGTPVEVSVAGTTLTLTVNPDLEAFLVRLAHFRLTLVEVAGASGAGRLIGTLGGRDARPMMGAGVHA